MNVLVTGGASHLGRDFVRAAMAAGHGVRIASQRRRPQDAPEKLEWATLDLGTGEGLRESLAGTDAVVHAASDPKDTTAVDVEGTRLAEAARAAGVGHLVFVSIVGIDRIPSWDRCSPSLRAAPSGQVSRSERRHGGCRRLARPRHYRRAAGLVARLRRPRTDDARRSGGGLESGAWHSQTHDSDPGTRQAWSRIPGGIQHGARR